jgi:hypothetical protein
MPVVARERVARTTMNLINMVFAVSEKESGWFVSNGVQQVNAARHLTTTDNEAGAASEFTGAYVNCLVDRIALPLARCTVPDRD